MPGRLENKVLLISGATGIAAATVRLAVAEGARVVAASLMETDCRALAREAPCEYLSGDLREESFAAEAVRRAVERFGRLDALFNVAGMSGRRFGDGPLHECTLEGWEKTLEANARTAFLLSREALRAMLGQAPDANGRRGAILNMSSVLALSPQAGHFATHAYAAAKGALVALTKAMAAYYALHGIRVNAIAPGLVRTPMSLRAQADAEILALMKSKQPLAGDLMDAEDVARAAIFLLSDEAGMITGEILTVDAGWRVS